MFFSKQALFQSFCHTKSGEIQCDLCGLRMTSVSLYRWLVKCTRTVNWKIPLTYGGNSGLRKYVNRAEVTHANLKEFNFIFLSHFSSPLFNVPLSLRIHQYFSRREVLRHVVPNANITLITTSQGQLCLTRTQFHLTPAKLTNKPITSYPGIPKLNPNPNC